MSERGGLIRRARVFFPYKIGHVYYSQVQDDSNVHCVDSRFGGCAVRTSQVVYMHSVSRAYKHHDIQRMARAVDCPEEQAACRARHGFEAASKAALAQP
jgi:hypothetical protein